MIGQKINNYEVRSLLGEGGMGSVYVAEHPLLGRRAAVKVLRRGYADDPTLVGRFINEARASSAIKHPGIIEVFDVGTLADGVPYLMMELLEGETLGRRIDREGRLKIDEAVDIARQAAAALAAAHGHGIVHRDLKPENLFLSPDPGQRSGHRVKVLDFGIAKLQRRLTGHSIRTHTGSIMGTPPYMSPEQCRGISSEIDHRTDIYALGIILYEMLTGAPPFLSEGFGDVLLMHLTQPPRPPREIDPNIPPAIEQVVLRALEKEPEHRLPSMDQLLRALAGDVARTTLREAPEQPVGSPEPAPTPVSPADRVGTGRPTTFSSTASQMIDTERMSVLRRRRLALGAGVLGAGLLVVGLVALNGGRGGSPPVSVARPASSNLSAAPAHPALPSPAPDPLPPTVVPSTAGPTTPAPPRAPSAEANRTPAAEPSPLTARRPGDKRTRTRSRRQTGDATAAAPAGPPEAAPAPAAVGAAPGRAPAGPAKPRLSTEKW